MVSLTNIIPTVTEKEAGYLAMFLGLALLKIQVGGRVLLNIQVVGGVGRW